MQTKKALSEVTVIPPHAVKEAGQFISKNDVQSLSFWKKLTPSKQEFLREEIRQLGAARMMHVSSGLAMGKHIRAIYNTCEPYTGAFRKLMTNFSFQERTAYRYMETYNNAEATFHENILKAAMVRGVNFLSYNKEEPLGKYTEVVRLLPPPRNPDIGEANRYIDQVEQTYKERKKALTEKGERVAPLRPPKNRNEWLMANYRGIRNALKSLPKRQRRAFLDDLFGMALTEAGIGSDITFSPQAIPEEFRQGPGRPRLDSEEAA